MAYRIDDGVQPTAETAIQAMIVRAQQVADRNGKAVGVHYDLTTDQVSLVEISPEVPKDVTFLRVASPQGGIALAPAEAVGEPGDRDPSEIKTASA